VTRNQQ